MNRACLVVLAVALSWPGKSAWAQGFLGGSGGLDPSFCQHDSIRQTLAYIDDMMMVDGQVDWASKLTGKLRATLMPGERVTVVRLSPATGESHEVWSGCWPAYTTEQRAKIAAQTYLFSANPLTTIDEQQRFFVRDFGAALTSIYVAAKRSVPAVQIDPDNPPNKMIVRALASDEGRFANSKQTIRAIVFSDMAENSDIGSVFKPAPAVNYGKKLGTYLRRSVFYAFAVGSDVRNARSVQETIRSFWNAALRSMNATVGGVGADLNVANSIPVAAHDYDVTLNFDGQKLDGRLAVLVDSDGALVDSWMGISRLSSATVTGTLHCTVGENGDCRIDAIVNGGLTTDSASEHLTLSGHERDSLTGDLGVKGSSAIFPITAVVSHD